jgi:hypothetical protein
MGISSVNFLRHSAFGILSTELAVQLLACAKMSGQPPAFVGRIASEKIASAQK